MRVVVIPPSGGIRVAEIDGLAAMQEIVGGFIEAVRFMLRVSSCGCI